MGKIGKGAKKAVTHLTGSVTWMLTWRKVKHFFSRHLQSTHKGHEKNMHAEFFCFVKVHG